MDRHVSLGERGTLPDAPGSWRRFAIVAALAILTAMPAAAQEAAQDTVARDSLAALRPQATRAELEALAAGKRGSITDAERRIVQARLTQGDFQPGDRVALYVAGEQALTDTFIVARGQTLSLPNIPEIPLKGVLRSELADYLTKQLSRYIRQVDLEATALVRIAVVGAVASPGFYNLPADMLVSDAIMAAGGPGGEADINKTVVRRGTVEIAKREEWIAAMQRGATLDELNIQSGDEIVVGTRSGGVRGTLQTVGLVSGVFFGIAALVSIFD